MMISTPPKVAVSQVVRFIKGETAFHLVRVCGERKQKLDRQSFSAYEFIVSTVGRKEAVIRDCIRNLEEEDKQLDQIKLWQ
jgi:putative transposase